jgi:hypothetical protein
MCKDTDLTDKIFTAWKNNDYDELASLQKQIPVGYSVCIVNPTHAHPTLVLVRNDEIETSVEGLYFGPDGFETRKRTLITDHGEG